MSNNNYNEIYSYFGEREKAVIQRIRRLIENPENNNNNNTNTENNSNDNINSETVSPDTINSTSNIGYDNVKSNNNDKDNNEPITKLGYDNVQISESVPITKVGYDNVPINQPESSQVKTRYENVSSQLQSSSNVGSNGYSNYDATNNSSNRVPSQYSGSDSHIVGDSSYSSGSEYNSNNGNSDPYSGEDKDNYSIDSVTGVKIEKSYVERDITEDDLILLESLIKYKARFGVIDETEQENVTDLLQKEEYQNFQSNPYLASKTAVTTNYSHPNFLTGKGIYIPDAVSGGRAISESSASGSTPGKSLTSWNDEFQRLLDMDDCLEKYERLSSLEQDFVYASETYGRIIISENFLANELKTIKPVAVGGIAGGEKYIVQGILFKFALENETYGLYGSDENAMKTAAHELNGCASFLNCGIKGLHVPLMAFIDYRGFRLMAMSLLPISKKTLIYGSCDGGQTVHTSNNIFNQLYSNATQLINLKPHKVQDMYGNFKSISGPIDIEGHVGSDNRFYLLDFARLSPPEPPKHRAAYLYKLLRLELVRKYNKPLCSDAFSPMASINVDVNNTEVTKAYDDLINIIIPKFADHLQTKDSISLGTRFNQDVLTHIFIKNTDVSKALHAEGINVRYLGEVASHCSDDRFKQFLYVECIVRTLKSLARELLRREMRKTHLPSDYPHRNLLLNFLNLIFDEYKGKTELFWCKIVYEKMEKKFQNIFLNRDENSTNSKPKYVNGQEVFKSMLESRFMRGKILLKFCKSIGLVLSPLSIDVFDANLSFVFVDPDIIEIKTLITRLNIIDYADGMSLYYKSMVPGLKPISKIRLLNIAKDRLEASLHSMGTNYFMILKLANVIRLLGKFDSGHSDRKHHILLALSTLEKLESYRIDQSLLLLSKTSRIKVFLEWSKLEILTQDQINTCIELIKDCIEASPNKAYPSYLEAKFYNRISKDYSKILSLYNHVISVEPNYQKAHIGVAIFLLKTQNNHKLFSAELVSDHITKAFALGNIDSIIGKIKLLVDFNPWVSFESSRNVQKLRIMVKSALEKKITENGNKIVLPKGVSFIEQDSYYFAGVKLEKLYVEQEVNIDMFANSQPQIISVVLRRIVFSDPTKVLKSLNGFSNLTSINLGFSSDINDEEACSIITPKLKKLKLHEIQGITDKTVAFISDTCKELEVLDLGGCKSILCADFNIYQKGCLLINKLALPPFVTDEEVVFILKQLPLIRLDLMKCVKVTHVSYKNAFESCPTLKKFRTPLGIPMINLPPQHVTSRYTKSNLQQPSLTYVFGGMELFNIKMGYGYNINQGLIFELYFNNANPLIRFRDPPSPLFKSNLFKAAHVIMFYQSISYIQIFKNSQLTNNWDLDTKYQISINPSPINNFRFNYKDETYSFLHQTMVTPAGIAFTNSLTLGSSRTPSVTVTDVHTNKFNVEINIKMNVNPIDIFFTIASGFKG